MNAKEFILDIATKQLHKEVVPGHNGPYHDPETQARNLSHWVITFSNCYQWTGDENFKMSALKFADLLLQKELRPQQQSFYHRDKEGKDQCNGLVGQAWTIEALIEASELSGDLKYRQLGIDVAELHRFNDDFKLWHILEIDGQVIELDPTFNHQLWYAASISPLINFSTPIKNQVEQFLRSINENLTVLKSGLIYHPIDRNLTSLGDNNGLKSKITNLLKSLYLHPAQLKRKYAKTHFHQQLADKSEGYHLFNLHAFSFLKSQIPNSPFFRSKNYEKLVNYALKENLFQKLDQNKYAYPYNAPGFEMPYFVSQLKDNERYVELANRYLNEQINKTYQSKTSSFSNNNPDPHTLTARIYELARTNPSFLEKLEI